MMNLNDEFERLRKENEQLKKNLTASRALVERIHTSSKKTSLGRIIALTSSDGIILSVDGSFRKGKALLEIIGHLSVGDLVWVNHLVDTEIGLDTYVVACKAEALLNLGEIAEFMHIMDEAEKKVLVSFRHDRFVCMAGPSDFSTWKSGDEVMIDVQSRFVLAHCKKERVQQTLLEQVPDVTFEDIAGLDTQIQRVLQYVVEPFQYPRAYARLKKQIPKGFVLWGRPGNGKTMMAKAIANKFGMKFFVVNGPELSNKFVGTTEERLRDLFARAEEEGKEHGSIIFFDEAESFLRRRGSDAFATYKDNYVTQFCSLIDGVEELKHVIIILATNRLDLLDEAILRPGRIDFKIEIPGPTSETASAVLTKYLTTTLPFEGVCTFEEKQKKISECTQFLIERLFLKDKTTRIGKLRMKDMEYHSFYLCDFVSNATLKNIIDRVKQYLFERTLNVVQADTMQKSSLLQDRMMYLWEKGTHGLRCEDFERALQEELKENKIPRGEESLRRWAKMERLDIYE